MEQRIMTTVFYGLIVLAGGAIAWKSGEGALQRSAAWMALDWIFCNTLFELMGPRLSTWASPSFAAFVAAMIGVSAFKHRSWAAWSIVVAFALQETITVAAFIHRSPGTPFYFGAQNAVFLLRWMIIGVAATYAFVARFGARARFAPSHGIRGGTS